VHAELASFRKSECCHLIFADGHGPVHAAGTPCSLKAKSVLERVNQLDRAANLEWLETNAFLSHNFATAAMGSMMLSTVGVVLEYQVLGT
jgi:hypothetical protein